MRTSTSPRNASTNPCTGVAVPRAPWPAIATVGASSTTRTSLTSVAVFSAATEIAAPAAVTWATSWIEAPAHIAVRSSPSPSSSMPRKGTSSIARHPSTPTAATARPASSSSESATELMAAIAAAPQIEQPAATSSVAPRGTPIRGPSQTVNTNVAASVPAASPTPDTPSDARSPSAIRRPSSATPARSRVLAAKSTPASAPPARRTSGEAARPSAIAHSSGLTPGIRPVKAKASATTAPTAARPRRRPPRAGRTRRGARAIVPRATAGSAMTLTESWSPCEGPRTSAVAP